MEMSGDAVREALEASIIAIDDWLHTFASEMCGAECVKASLDRIMESGGTLAYIADVQKRNRAALATPQAEPCPECLACGDVHPDWCPRRSAPQAAPADAHDPATRPLCALNRALTEAARRVMRLMPTKRDQRDDEWHGYAKGVQDAAATILAMRDE